MAQLFRALCYNLEAHGFDVVFSVLCIFFKALHPLVLECIFYHNNTYVNSHSKGKGRAVPLQAWSGPEVSSKLSFLDFMTTAQDSGKVVSLTHRPRLPPGNTPGNHFC